LTRVVAIASPDNAASNGLLRKLGLRFCRLTHLTPEGPASNLYQIEFGPSAA
jgi:RimJ/RimL family protein N-acetyltransferase